MAFSGSGTTFNDASLTAATNYFYAVFAFTGSGITSSYLKTAPLSSSTLTLDPEPTAQPTAFVFSNITSNSLTAAFTAASPAPSGYIIVRWTGVTPTGTPVDGTNYTVGNDIGNGKVAYVGTNVTLNETGLANPMTTLYRVYSFNNEVGGINYLTTAPLQGGPDSTPPAITNQTNASISGATKISATIIDQESGVASATVQVRSISGNQTYATLNLSNTTNNLWQSADIPAAIIGETGLDFKITATNGQGISVTSANFKALVSYADQTIPYNGAGTTQTSYRLLSFPLNLTDKSIGGIFGTELGAYNKANWRMFKHDGAENFSELSNGSQVEIGKGYWFISKVPATLTTGPGTAASVSADQPFTMNLVQGWNLIGNPYLFNILWSDVMTASGGAALTPKKYNGAFVDGTVINAFEGAFVMSATARTLTFPTAKNAAAGRIKDTENNSLHNPLDNAEWEIQLTVKNADIVNKLNGVGMRPTAKEDYDQFDDFTLPRLLDYVELNHQKSFLKIQYSKDVIPTKPNHVWEFTVDTNLHGLTELSWDNSYFGDNDKQIMLFDVENQAVIDMRTRTTYAFESTSKHQFKIVFGNEEFVRENALPEGLMINSIYPNPSASSVTVAFTTPNFPGQINVGVKVSNTLGQPLSTLHTGPISPGYHELKWSGNDASGTRVSPGIYLIEVRVGKQVKIEKVIVK